MRFFAAFLAAHALIAAVAAWPVLVIAYQASLWRMP